MYLFVCICICVQLYAFVYFVRISVTAYENIRGPEHADPVRSADVLIDLLEGLEG